jgi:hypothetical protein
MKKNPNEEEEENFEIEPEIEDINEIIIVDEEDIDSIDELDDFYKDPFIFDDEFDDPTNNNVYRITCTYCSNGNSEDCDQCNGTGLMPGERYGGLDIDDTMMDE